MSSYSNVEIVKLDAFKMALYVIISPFPENDVQEYMKNWAKKSGLLEYKGYTPKIIGWDFPFVSDEQKEKFGLRGYVCAYVIPEDFIPVCDGAEVAYCKADTYARITITNPHENSFESIPKAYETIFKFTDEKGITCKSIDERLIFEEEFDKDDIHYMNVYIPVDILECEAKTQ